MKEHLRPTLVLLAAFTVLTGMAYPAFITAVSQAVFPHQANGSLILRHGRAVGSELIGRQFSAPRYFWGRPSATSPHPYDATAGAGSNLGPSNPDLRIGVAKRVQALQQADPTNNRRVPVDLVTASASGLDPHVSPAAAEYQVPRVARCRGLSETKVRSLVARCTEGRQWGFLGEPRVNVLRLNLALDATFASARSEIAVPPTP
jgi:potassium-transporting ATPase KdpC subunit